MAVSTTSSASSLSLVASARSVESPPSITTSLFSARSPTTDESSISQTHTSSPSASSLAQKASPRVDTASPTAKALNSTRSTHSKNKPQEAKMDYLEFLYPKPQRPPRYSSHKAARAITFPIYEQTAPCELPAYTPAVTDLTLVLRKVEWLSPFEASTVRGWKNLIMELNSTQLNFYAIDGIPILSKVKKSKTKKHYEFTPVEQEFILETVKRNPQKYMSEAKLVQSYSLQHARFGLPIDYKKRQSCLRLRCETEQFIIQFLDLDILIRWATNLSVGINVSLDLDTREMPTDRIVPRRRRNRRNRPRDRHRALSDSELIRRELAEPKHPRRASFSGESTGLKSKISRIFGRKRANTVDMEQLAKEYAEEGSESQLEIKTVSNIMSPSSSVSNTPEVFGGHSRHESTSSNLMTTRIREERINTGEEEDEDEDEVDEVDEDEEGDDIPDNEIHSIRELHDSDDEESIHEAFSNFTLTPSTLLDGSMCLDEKWNPDPKKYSRRKFLKDSIRCIKLLSNQDTWVGKKVVMASAVSTKPGMKRKRIVWEECTVGLQGFIPTHALQNQSRTAEV